MPQITNRETIRLEISTLSVPGVSRSSMAYLFSETFINTPSGLERPRLRTNHDPLPALISGLSLGRNRLYKFHSIHIRTNIAEPY